MPLEGVQPPKGITIHVDSGTRRFTNARRRDLQDARSAIRAALDGGR
jgi:hypothetical protein